jgi:antitoxin component of MazEF toxin-antitoxin module
MGSIITTTRKVLRLGNSLAITLPVSFTRAHGIKEGDDLPIVADHILKIIPMLEGREEDEYVDTRCKPRKGKGEVRSTQKR